MSHEKEPKEPFSVHTDFTTGRGDGQKLVVGHVHGDEGMSLDEVRHRTAEQQGADPAEITIIDTHTGEVNTAPKSHNGRSRSWGFSKWGAKWEPTGPKGDPNLN